MGTPKEKNSGKSPWRKAFSCFLMGSACPASLPPQVNLNIQIIVKIFTHRFLALFLLAGIISTGCSFSYVDDEGYKHVMGLVDVKLATVPGTSEDVAESIDVTSVGIAFYSNPLNSGLALGYNREGITVLQGNNCVAVDMDSNQGSRLKPVTEMEMINAFERIAHEND